MEINQIAPILTKWIPYFVIGFLGAYLIYIFYPRLKEAYKIIKSFNDFIYRFFVARNEFKRKVKEKVEEEMNKEKIIDAEVVDDKPKKKYFGRNE